VRVFHKLNARFCDSVTAPGRYLDGDGLHLEVTESRSNRRPSGSVNKAWVKYFAIDGAADSMGIGPYRLVPLSEARRLNYEASRLLAQGINPRAHRDAARRAARAAELHTATFGHCLDGFLASHGDGWRTKHARQWRNSMQTYCKPLFDVAVGDVDVAMVLKVIEPEWKRAPATMDRVRRRIGEVLAWAEVRGYRKSGPLPTRWKNHLDKLLPHPRSIAPVVHHAALHFDAVPELYRKLIATDAVPELCLAFTVLTTVRSQEARGARWDEIDTKARTWVVPPERMKRKRPHRVPLSDEAMAIIRRLPRKGEYLFTVNGNGKPIVAMSLRKALFRHGGDGFTVHGFRSAFRDWGGERTSVARELLEVALSHHIGDATEQAYARGDLLEKRRRLMQQWATFLSAPSAGKVVSIGGGRRHG